MICNVSKCIPVEFTLICNSGPTLITLISLIKLLSTYYVHKNNSAILIKIQTYILYMKGIVNFSILHSYIHTQHTFAFKFSFKSAYLF